MAQVSVVASNTGNANSGGTGTFSVAITKPTGTADGDLLIAHFQTSDSTLTVDTLAGWTLKDSDLTSGNGSTYIFYKMASSEGSSYTWTVNINGLGGNKGILGGIVAFRNTHQTTPILVQTKNVDATSNTTAVGTALTPTRAPDGLLVAFTSNPAQQLTYSAHSIANNNPSWTEVYDTNANGGAPAIETIVCAYGLYPYITTTGAYNATISGAEKSTTYLLYIVGLDFNFSVPQLSLTDTLSAQESSAQTVSAGFTLTNTISATIAQGVSAILNIPKSVSTWLNLDKS